MSKTDQEKELRNALQRLEQSAQKVVETRGYTKEVAKIRLLEEIIREQLKNENSRTTTRPVR
jgi:hypothetical protein